PLYKLLGGKTREKVLVYCHANGSDLSGALDDVGRHIELGYKAIRVQSGVPGIKDTYGVPRHGEKYEPALREQPPKESRWNTEKYLRSAPVLFNEGRSTYGDDLYLLPDVHHRLKPIEAARLGKDLEPFRLFWMEDAIPADMQEG